MKKVFYVLLLVALIIGCERARKTDPTTLVLGTAQQFESLDFIISEMAATSYIHGFTNRGFVRFDANWEMTTALAKEIPTFENGLAEVYQGENIHLFKISREDYTAELNEGKLSDKLWEIFAEKLQRYGRDFSKNVTVTPKTKDKHWTVTDNSDNSLYMVKLENTKEPDQLEVTGDVKCVKMTWEFLEDAKWGDGTPVTVDDFILTWKVGQNDMVKVGARENYTDILKFEKVDDHKFIIYKKKVDYQYNRLSEDWFKPMPSHLMGDILDKPLTDPEDYEKRTPYTHYPTNPGLYNGPYVVQELELGSHLILKENPHFYGKKPSIKTIIIKLIQDTSTLEANLLSGTIDYIPGEVGSLTINQGTSFMKRHTNKGYEVIFKSGLIYEHIDMDHENPILADLNVRKALLYGMNRKGIIEEVFEGKLQIAHTSISPLDSVYWDEIEKYEYNPKKAAKLLDEAGWKMGDDGVRYNDKGEALQLTFMTTAGNSTRELVQQLLQANWKELGILANIKNQPARVYFGTTVKRGEYTGLAMFAWISSPENVPKTTLHSVNIPSKENGYNGQNSGHYSNPKMDKALVQCELELNPKKRMEHWKTIQELYAKDLPALPLYFRANVYIKPTWLKNVKPTGNQYASSYSAEEWEIVLPNATTQ